MPGAGVMPYDIASMSLSSPSSPFSPEHSLRESTCSSFDDEATEEFPTLCISSSKELDLCLILSLLAILASKSTSILVQMLRPFFPCSSLISSYFFFFAFRFFLLIIIRYPVAQLGLLYLITQVVEDDIELFRKGQRS